MAFQIKRPADGKQLTLRPNYQYVNETQQKNRYSRSLHTALHEAQVYTFKRFELHLPKVTAGEAQFLEDWFKRREHLRFTQDSTVVNVDLGFQVKIVNYQLRQFPRPYTRTYKMGSITLEEF